MKFIYARGLACWAMLDAGFELERVISMDTIIGERRGEKVRVVVLQSAAAKYVTLLAKRKQIGPFSGMRNVVVLPSTSVPTTSGAALVAAGVEVTTALRLPRLLGE